MRADVETIRESVTLISELTRTTDSKAQDQSVCWIMNKENHAQGISGTISDFFLTQRLKASQDDYAHRLQKHNAVVVAAMRTKQDADMAVVDELKAAVKSVAPSCPPHEH